MHLMPDPTVREMLLTKIDELTDKAARDLDEIRSVTLVPEARTASRICLCEALSWVSRRRVSSRSSTARS